MDNTLINREAELAVIGAMMKGAKADLTAEDFGDKDLGAIYKIITQNNMDGKPVDMVSLNSATGSTLTPVLIEANGIGIPSLIKHHADIVRACSIRRQAGELARELYKGAVDHMNDPISVLDNTRQKIGDLIGGQRHEWMSASELAIATYDWINQLADGQVQSVSTSIRTLDNLIGGFFPGELTIVGAKPGTGKTVFGMVLALEAAKRGKRVGVMNLEMLDSQYGSRIFANLANIDAMKLRRGAIDDEDRRLLASAMSVLSKLPAAFLFKSRYIEELKAAVRNKELDLLVVDYMQLVRTRQDFESERLRMGHVSWSLKELAIEQRIPVVVMSQLRRPDSSAADKMPSMRDLRESGNLEADADGIILLHEPSSAKDPYVYSDDKQGFEEWKKQGLRYIAMKVEKQRQGNVGTIPVLFDGAHMRYREIVRER